MTRDSTLLCTLGEQHANHDFVVNQSANSQLMQQKRVEGRPGNCEALIIAHSGLQLWSRRPLKLPVHDFLLKP